MRSLFLAILAIQLLCVPSFISAQAPDSISFQGRLTDPAGVAIESPSVSMTFKIYKAGVAVWTETHPAVKVDSGISLYF